MAIASGTRIGPYEVIEKIGAGGMGEVYRATDTTLEREVAIKVLPESFAADAGRIARFAQEAKTLAALNHSHIAQIYGLEKAGDATVIVMELVDGPTLADRIAQGAIPPDEALNIALQVADALEAAHGQSIVHRDLKPANIKLRPDGTIKVLDFGIAKALEPLSAASGGPAPIMTTPVTQIGVILGTAAYMSPEQARGKAIDERTDIWAFGCLLYEMLTGQPAFGGEDVPLTLARVLAHDTDMTTLPGMISPAVRQTLRLCLQKDPRKRVADIRDVKLALTGAFETGTQASAAAGVAARRLWQRPLPVAVGALVVGGLIAGGAAWNLQPPAEPPVVTRFVLDLPQDRAFRNMGRDIVALSADGRYLAYNAAGGLYLRAMEETEARALPGTETAMTNPFFSSDGEWVGYWDLINGQLKKSRISGGAPVPLATIRNPFGAAWGSDDFIVFGQAGGIFRVSANGGDPELLIAADPSEDFWDPQVLPDGSILYAAFGDGPGTIRVETPGRADRTELFAAERAIYLPTGHLVTAEAVSQDALRPLFVRSFDLATRAYGGPVPIEEGVLFAQGKTHFTASPSGTLAFATGIGVGAADTALALVDRKGSVELLDVEPNQYRGPRVSRDGTRVAVEIIGENARSSVWIYDLSGSRAFRPLLGAGSNVRPIWTPDGERLTYASDRDGTWGIYWQPADGSGVAERLTTAEEGVEHWPDSWSADGKTLAFTRIQGSLEAIALQEVWTVTLDAEGRPEDPVVLIPRNAGGAAFSPIGNWIAYRSNDATVGEIQQLHVQPFPPTGGVYAVTDQGGSYPTWSRDGTELFYRRPAAGSNTFLTLGSVEVTSGASFAWGNETTLAIQGGIAFFGYRDYDLMPDGERLVTGVVADASGAAAPAETGFSIEVVANWSELAKERAPAR
jgi:serine/threonine-protein kinase